MKTLAGGYELNKPVYADAIPSPDRTPAPADEVARFMASQLFHCNLLAARISARQCEVNRSNDLYSCSKCEQALLAAPVPKPRKPYGKRYKRALVPADQHTAPATPWRTQLYDRAALADHEAKSIGVDLASGPDMTATAIVTVEKGEVVLIEQVRSGQVRSGQVRSADH